MRLIAFITEGAQTGKILDHIGLDSAPPRIAPARAPPLWDGCDARIGEGVEIEPDWDLAAQPAPDYEVDQRIHWCGGKPALQTRCGEAACGAPGAPEITLLG